MGSDNTNRRTVETEFKKAMVRVNVPVGLLVTAFGIGLMVLVGSYLIKYFRGAVPLREVYGTEQAGDEYVSFDKLCAGCLHGKLPYPQRGAHQEQYILSGAG